MASIRLRLLGPFHLQVNDVPVTSITPGRQQSLLAYLALHRHVAQPRHHLAFLFWPDSSEQQALTNLRKLLFNLRQELPNADDLLEMDAKQVRWQPAQPFTLDVEQFDAHLDAAAALSAHAAIATLQEACALYRGDFLDGNYDEWVIDERVARRATYVQTLERLLLLLEDVREVTTAIGVAHQLLRQDPLLETTYRRLMRLYALQGDRAAALNVYQTCVNVLARELHVEPGADIQQAYAQLLNHQIPVVLRANGSSALEHPPFIGRHPEWRLLMSTWRASQRGQAQLMVIAGEAGIGKTRLAEEFLHWAQQQGVLAARAHAYAAEGQLAYSPIIEWLRAPALRPRLAALDEPWRADVARLLPELAANIPPTEPNPPDWQRHRLFEALAQALLCDEQPLLLVLDDLQWSDQETLAWLHFVLRFAPQAKLLIVATVRQEEVGMQHPLAELLLALRATSQLTEVALAPLDADETVRLSQEMSDYHVSDDAARRLYAETEGHPLFIVEMLRAHLQDPDGLAATWTTRRQPANQPVITPRDTALPPRIHAVIDMRLGQLSPPAHKVADLAAVIGRDFNLAVLTHAIDCSEDELMQGLDELLQRHIVRERDDDSYDFSHDKLREAIYLKLSSVRRQVLHRRIAEALETAVMVRRDAVSSQIAAHFDQGNLPARAIPAYANAARAARHVDALLEATELLRRGLALLDELPRTAEWARQEWELLLQLGPVLVARYGYGQDQVRDVYVRAEAIRQELDEPPNSAILRALALYYIVRRDYAKTHEQGEALRALADGTAADGTAANCEGERETAALYAEAYYVLGVEAFWRGEFARSREYLTDALTYCDTLRHARHIALYSQDPGVVCHVRLAFSLWFLGFADQAQRHCREGLALARQIDHPFTLCYALNFSAWLHTECGDYAAATTYVIELAAHSEKYGMEYWLPVALLLRGYSLEREGEIEAGMTLVRAGMRAYQTAVVDLYEPYTLAVLAKAFALDDDVEQGLAAIDEALAGVAQHGDAWYNAELLRIRGDLLQQQGAPRKQVETHYRQALDLARDQGAQALVLRATLSLCRLWLAQGKQTRASRLLTHVVRSFEEGHQTSDLQAAQTLLDQLEC